MFKYLILITTANVIFAQHKMLTVLHFKLCHLFFIGFIGGLQYLALQYFGETHAKKIDVIFIYLFMYIFFKLAPPRGWAPESISLIGGPYNIITLGFCLPFTKDIM